MPATWHNQKKKKIRFQLPLIASDCNTAILVCEDCIVYGSLCAITADHAAHRADNIDLLFGPLQKKFASLYFKPQVL